MVWAMVGMLDWGINMNRTTLTLLTALTIALPTLARIGETQQECEARYGKPVEETAGFGDVKNVRVYWKDDTEITAFFVSKVGQPPTVGLIYYRLGTNYTQRMTAPHYTDDQTKALLATVNGTWTAYTPPPALSGPKPLDPWRSGTGTTKLAPVTSQIESRRAESFTAVQNAGKIRFPGVVASYYPVSDISHVGNTHFSFSVEHGMAIVAYDAVFPVRVWVEQKQREKQEAEAKPQRKMTGF